MCPYDFVSIATQLMCEERRKNAPLPGTHVQSRHVGDEGCITPLSTLMILRSQKMIQETM